MFFSTLWLTEDPSVVSSNSRSVRLIRGWFILHAKPFNWQGVAKSSSKPVLEVFLGCHGQKDDDFVICSSVENKIYTVESDFYYFNPIMDFLDKCKLFDCPLSDFNAIRNFLSLFREKFEIPMSPKWSERKYIAYQKFLIDHRNCGVFLYLNSSCSEQRQNQETE